MVASKVSSRDVQRLFLQAIISRRILSEKLAKNLWQRCIEAVRAAGELEIPDDSSDAAWDEFITKVNQNIDSFDLEFRHVVDEATSTKLYAIVNTKGDEVAQLASDYTPLEIAYFKAVVEQIMLASNNVFSIASRAALREATFLKSNLTKSQAEVVLGSLVARGWLLKSKKGRYSLAPRSLLELDAYLRQNYEDESLECTICHELVTKGKICPRDNCHTYMHLHCYNAYRKSKSDCPSCKISWLNENNMKPLGEDAARDGQDDKRKVRRKSGANETDGEEMDASQEMDATQAPTQTQPRQATQTQKGKGKKAAAKGRGKKRAETPETDEEEPEPTQDPDEGMNIDDVDQIAEPTQTRRRSRNRRE